MKTVLEPKNRITSLTNGNGDEPTLITPPNIVTATFLIEGTAPLCINRFPAKAVAQMKEKQEAGSKAKKGQKRKSKNFNECYEDAKHISTEGWDGVNAAAFRNALISACRVVDFKMTLAKLSLFILADGYDRVDSTPLVRIIKGKPRRVDSPVILASGVADIRPRPVWQPGWQIRLRIQFDADQFSLADVANLLARAGLQVGIGEGRPASKSSNGIGYGTFRIINERD